MTIPSMPSTPQFLTWQDVDKLIDYLLPQLAWPVRCAADGHPRRHRAGRPDRRGVGHHHILTAAVQFPEAGQSRLAWPNFLQFPEDRLLRDKRILIVDDIWANGRTITTVKGRVQAAGGRAEAAVLHYKPTSSLFRGAGPRLLCRSHRSFRRLSLGSAARAGSHRSAGAGIQLMIDGCVETPRKSHVFTGASVAMDRRCDCARFPCSHAGGRGQDISAKLATVGWPGRTHHARRQLPDGKEMVAASVTGVNRRDDQTQWHEVGHAQPCRRALPQPRWRRNLAAAHQ